LGFLVTTSDHISFSSHKCLEHQNSIFILALPTKIVYLFLLSSVHATCQESNILLHSVSLTMSSEDYELQINLKVCDDGSLIQILRFWISFIHLFSSKTPSPMYLKTQRFGDWILSPSSVKTYSEDGDRIQSPKLCVFK
jgi:hypothetical protein